MQQFAEQPELAAQSAIKLRARLRALACAENEAFDLLYYEFGAASATGVVITKVATRLSFLAALLADLAWTNGERSAHDGTRPPPAPEADAVRRVFRYHASERRRFAMNADQRSAVVAYLDALALEVARCIELEEHAPSATLGREARQFVGAVTEVRRATCAH
jgi:hypothetical protein